MTKSVGINAPDTRNYLIGKGFCVFLPSGETTPFHMGNATSLELTPAVDKLEHFSSMEGTKTKDDTVVTLKKGTLKGTFEEMTAKNLALLMLGDVDEDGYGGATIDLFSRTSFSGEFWFYASNDKGPRWKIHLPKVTWNPSGAFNPISDAYANIQLEGDWESSDGDFGTMELMDDAGTVVPDNVLDPFITGSAVENETLTAWFGGWVGASGYTYVWKADAVAIVGATSKTFVLTADEVGSVITCTITASNTVGSASATTAATAAVIAA